jgi:hypothetical protein
MGLTKPRAAQIFNLDYKQSTRVVTVTNINLTGGAPNQVDGVNLSLNDRVLVIGQSTGSQNGLYYVTTVGSGSNGTWIRTSDGNENGEIEAGMIVMVTEGAIYADTQWKLITDDPIVINTTALTFTQNYMANSIVSGSSNVTVFSNANVTISSAGTANVLTISSTGIVTTGSASVNNDLIVNSNGGEGGQLVMAWAGVGGLAGQANSTWNLDVDSSNNLRAFSVNAVGTANVILNLNSATRVTTFGGDLLPSANVTYNLGSPTQRWKEIFLAANTIDIGGALISADLATGSLILTGPDGAEFILTGTSPTTSVGQFGMIEVSNSMSSHNTTTGALTVVGGAGIGGNINVGGTANISGNSISLGNLVLKDDGSNIFGLYAADGTTPATISQNSVDTTRISNGTSNVQVVSANSDVTISVGGTSNVVVVSTTGANIIGTLGVTANVTGGNLNTAGLVQSTGNVIGGNVVTAGQVSATGNVSGSTLIASGNIVVQSRQQIKLYDTDNSNFISFRAPNALTGDYILTLPTGYGNADQVLSTNGAGTLSWATQTGGGGGGSATSYPNSTVQPVPGSTGNFDLSYDYVQTSQETPFESSATDPFGVNLGEVYSMMDPGGEILEPVDLGLLT